MIIRPSHTEKFCPYCHLSFGTGFDTVSYSCFSNYSYTDGFFLDSSGFHEKIFFTQCPYCKKIFAKRYFLLQEIKKEFNFNTISNIKNDKDSNISDKKEITPPVNNLIGDQNCFYGIYTPSFWKKIIEIGLCYPEGVSEKVKENDLDNIYIKYWYSCNHGKGYDKNCEEYQHVMDRILKIFNSDDDSNKLIRAEVYRNKGEFERSLEILRTITVTERNLDRIYTIIKADRNRIKDTLLVEKDNKLFMVLQLEDCEYKKRYLDELKLVVINMPEEYPEGILNVNNYDNTEDHFRKMETEIVFKEAWNNANKWELPKMLLVLNDYRMCEKREKLILTNFEKEAIVNYFQTKFCLKGIDEKLLNDDMQYYVITLNKDKLFYFSPIRIDYYKDYKWLCQFGISNGFVWDRDCIAKIDEPYNLQVLFTKRAKELQKYFEKYKEKIQKVINKNKIINVINFSDVIKEI